MATVIAEEGQLLLKTRYEDREQAKAVGCRWDPKRKAWIIPPDTLVGDLEDYFGGSLFLHESALRILAPEEAHKAHLVKLKGADDAVIRYPEDLSPYQRVGVRFLADAERAILADDVGLGKTAIAVRAALEVEARRVLVVCPKSLITHWVMQIKRWANEDAGVLLSDGWEKAGHSERSWVVTNYEAATKHVDDLQGFECLIVDEASRIKNRTGRRKGVDGRSYSAPVQRTKTVHRLAREVKWCWLLTATPTPNNPAELWSLLHTIQPDKYTSYWRWVSRRCDTYRNPWGGVEIVGLKDPQRFTEEVAPLMLRREKSLLKLPPLSEETIYVGLTEEQERLYRQLRQLYLAVLDDEKVVTAPSVLAQMTRLRQVCCSPALIGGSWASGKTDAIMDLLEDYAATHKILIFSTFAEYIRLLEEALSQYNAVRITGDMSTKARSAAERRFNEDPNCRVLLGTVGAMGEGLNLQAASLVIFANRDWVPAAMEQAVGRAWRRGQEKPVHTIVLVTARTVEEHVERLVEAKQVVSSQVGMAALANAIKKEVI